MGWPIFEMPLIGNRMLIALIALIHVSISHGMAVGGSFFIVSLHYKSLREHNERLSQLTYKLLRIFFIVTTSVGALTGVGIWLTTTLVSPATMASLLYVFFWAWFVEWIIFVAEIVLIMIYYLNWGKYGAEKSLKIGVIYAVVSWLAMLFITGILSAMLTPGKWIATGSIWDGFFNPGYLPQLLTRTSLAALLSLGFGLFIMRFYKSYRDQWPIVWTFAGKGLMIMAPIFLFSVLNYYHILPQQIDHLIVTALMTAKYAAYAQFSKIFFIFIVISMMVLGFILYTRKNDYKVISFVPILLMIIALGTFERVREFIRKPYTIYHYLYSNGIRQAEVPFLNKNGVSEFTAWAERTARETDPFIRKGEKIFKLECSVCHTFRGFNAITKKTAILQNTGSNEKFLKTIERSHSYMPPFVGTDEERAALAAYLNKIIKQTDPVLNSNAEANH